MKQMIKNLLFVVAALLLPLTTTWAYKVETMEIATPDDLMEFIERVYEGETELNAVLTADIDMGNYNSIEVIKAPKQGPEKISSYLFYPIEGAYNGTFDGQGYTIRNLYMYGENTYMGIFQTIDVNGVVKNLTLRGNVEAYNSSSATFIGSIAGENDGLIQNCKSVMDFEVYGDYGVDRVGGICGYNNGTVENCEYIGTIEIYENMLYFTAPAQASARMSAITVEEIGGIVGWNIGRVSGCKSHAAINIGNNANTWGKIGAIIGYNALITDGQSADGVLENNKFNTQVVKITQPSGPQNPILAVGNYQEPEVAGKAEGEALGHIVRVSNDNYLKPSYMIIETDKDIAKAGEKVTITAHIVPNADDNRLYNVPRNAIVQEAVDASVADAPMRVPGFADPIDVTKVDTETWTFTMPDYNVFVEVEAFLAIAFKKHLNTLCYPATFSVPDGLKAYTITEVDLEAGTAKLSEPLDYIFSDLPMIIEKVNDSEDYYPLPFDYAVPITRVQKANDLIAYPEYDSEHFHGVDWNTDYPYSFSAWEHIYVLSDGLFRLFEGDLEGGKCYLQTEEYEVVAKPYITLMTADGEATGVIAIDNSQLTNGKWYDLNGRKLDGKPSQKGVYIINGKKQIMK